MSVIYGEANFRRQAALSKLSQGVSNRHSTRGVLLRGTVQRVYRYDAEPTSLDLNEDEAPRGTYADVLTYTSIPGGSMWRSIKKCLILQGRGGRHDGDIAPLRGPRDGFGAGVDFNKTTSPVLMDGDHVLIGFIDDRQNFPVILGCIPHPKIDTGTVEGGTPHLRVLSTDGQPRMWKHQGTTFGVIDGSYNIDLTQAHLDGDGTPEGGGGVDATNGKEIPSTATRPNVAGQQVAAAGNFTVQLSPGATVCFQWYDADGTESTQLKITDAEGESRIDLRAKTVSINAETAEITATDAVTTATNAVITAETIRLGADEEDMQEAVLGSALNTWLTSTQGLSVQTAFGPSGPSITALTGEAPDPTGTPPDVLSKIVTIKE